MSQGNIIKEETATQARAHKGPESLVLLNTGDGKGKTTAALGVMMRALAQGWRVSVIQFLKSDDWETSEENIFSQLGVNWIKCGEGRFTWSKNYDPEVARAKAQAGWKAAKEELKSKDLGLLVLDEIALALKFGWLEEEEVIHTIQERSPNINVILTGREASESLIKLADVVTEMRKIKHPFDKGIVARTGIDY